MNARFIIMVLAVLAALQAMLWVGLSVLHEAPLSDPVPHRPATQPKRAAAEAPAVPDLNEWSSRMLETLALSAEDGRHEKTLALFLQWVAQRPADAMTWGEETLEGETRDAGLAQGLAAWAKSNPAAAAKWLEGMTDEPAKESLVLGLIQNWAPGDGLAAALWLDKLGSTPGVRAKAAAELAKTWAQTNPRDAVEWSLLEYNKTGQTAAFQAAFASGIVDGSVEATRDFIAQIPPGEVRSLAIGQFATAYTAAAPLPAFRWAATLPDPAEGRVAVEKVIDVWARSEPSKAAEALTYIENPEANAAATAALMQRWVASDAVSASSWLNALPAGAPKDSAILKFSDAMIGHDPAAALQWSLALQDENTRLQTAVALGGQWLADDPVKATSWLQQSALPPDVVQTILQLNRVQNGALQSTPITDPQGNPPSNYWTPGNEQAGAPNSQ